MESSRNAIRNTFKYHVSWTDGKISVRIIIITYFSTVASSHSQVVFFPVGIELGSI